MSNPWPDPTPDPKVPLSQRVFAGLTNVGTSVAANVLGHLLAGIIGGDDSAALAKISAQLEQLANDIHTLQATVDNFVSQYLASEEFDGCERVLAGPVRGIEGDFNRLISLTPAQVKDAKHLAEDDVIDRTTAALSNIHEVMTGIFPLVPGNLLHAFTGRAAAACTGPGYSPADPAPLMRAYEHVESYFRGMINVQTKASLLLINAYQAGKDQAGEDRTRKTLRDNVTEQCQWFLAAIEELTVAYHHDATLLDMLLGPPEHDPLRAANAFVNLYPPQNVARLWMWSGRGASFDVTTFHGQVSVLTPAELDPTFPFSPHLTATVETPVPVTFPVAGDLWSKTPAGADTWTMIRLALGEPESRQYHVSGGAAYSTNAVATRDPAHAGGIFKGFPLGPGSCASFFNVTSLRFDRKDAAIRLPDSLSFDHERVQPGEENDRGWPFTLEMWVDPEAAATLAMGYSFVDHVQQWRSWRLRVRDDGVLALDSLYFTNQGPDQFTELVAGRINLGIHTNVWHHVAMVFDGQVITLYVDGVPDGTVSYHRIRGPEYIGAWRRAGSRYTEDHMQGFISEVRVWERAVSPAEIVANMGARLSAGDKLRAAYGFDRGHYLDRAGNSGPAECVGEERIGFDRSFSGLPWLG